MWLYSLRAIPFEACAYFMSKGTVLIICFPYAPIWEFEGPFCYAFPLLTLPPDPVTDFYDD